VEKTTKPQEPEGNQGIGPEARHLLIPLPLESDRRAEHQSKAKPEDCLDEGGAVSRHESSAAGGRQLNDPHEHEPSSDHKITS
jgi:hypothetical protein